MTENNARMSAVEELIAIGKALYQRKWIMGIAGNFSAVVSRKPFELAITQSGVHRGALTSSDFVYLNKSGRPSDPGRPPSAEAPIHSAIISNTGAGAVLQTHSVWSTVLADVYAPSAGLELQGFEVLKSLPNLKTGRHVEWVPILENSEDYLLLAGKISRLLKTHPEVHAILLRKHGFYTWGKTIQQAVHHVEIFELVFEVFVRKLHIFAQVDLKEHRGSSA